MPEPEKLTDHLTEAVLGVWEDLPEKLFDEQIKPNTELGKDVAVAVAIVTKELVWEADDEEAVMQKKASLESAKRIVKRLAERAGAVVEQEVWERSWKTLEAVGFGVAKFAKGVLGGLA